jgi:hypothetical protein
MIADGVAICDSSEVAERLHLRSCCDERQCTPIDTS